MSVTTRRDAASIREEWLRVALSTEPADRPEAEAAITGLYRLNGLPPPRFHWVSSPAVASEVLPPGVRADREALTALFGRAHTALTRELDRVPRVADDPVTQRALRPLDRSALPFRMIGYHHDGDWWRVHSVTWLARYDAMPVEPESEGFALWARLARAGGWWLPYPRECVVADRPKAVHTRPAPENAVMLHNADGPAVVYRDGWAMYAWRGRRVPPWVIEHPTAERIRNEPEAAFRRAAIERLGWAEYLVQAGFPPIATAPDPGNDTDLRLYHVEGGRVLVAVNGTVERDGTRRRYAINVPPGIVDPVEAAAWTYGLTADVYARLVRRT